MSLFTATLLPGLFLILFGALLVSGNSMIAAMFKAMPRSSVATAVFWGGGALWFLYLLWRLSQADLVVFDSSKPFVLIFAVIALAAFYYIPDFLAVRGLSVIALLAAWQVLMGLFGEYDHPLRLFSTALMYVGIVIPAIYMGCVPYRARDLLEWVYAQASRARMTGGAMAVYGAVLVAISFTY